MNVLVPPRPTRFKFWAVGFRLPPEYRPWVAQQIARPDYAQRRVWPVIALQTVLVVLPQGLLALTEHSRARLVLLAALLGFWAVYAVVVLRRRTPMSAAARSRLLAYHGVTADGELRTPVSALDVNPLGRAGLALLCAQVLLVASGTAVAADQISARRACHAPATSDTAALRSAIGVPAPGGTGFYNPDPVVPRGVPLVGARKVESGVTGVHFVAAYVRAPTGRLLGPAVWRVIDPQTVLNPLPDASLSAWGPLARQITPSTGYGFASPDDPVVRKARDCAAAAR